ncbi:hypothetical protein I545_5184 [Mycobacterium kansasii 662]|uniref:Uncharacterized protein n=1 Tax=Mycobacterium kansasii 662 TaxID=1299326 RepID=X7YZW6_MYCKA|nr:hypothetical protein I545_5184 [Mycobacterium kansasii 662]
MDVEIWPPPTDEPLRMRSSCPPPATTAEVGFAIFGIEVTLPVDAAG